MIFSVIALRRKDSCPRPLASALNVRRAGPGRFGAKFNGTVVLTLPDAPGGFQEFLRLQLPSWIHDPPVAAKILGPIAILPGRTRSLKDFAQAGFLHDLLFAAGANLDAELRAQPRFRQSGSALAALRVVKSVETTPPIPFSRRPPPAVKN